MSFDSSKGADSDLQLPLMHEWMEVYRWERNRGRPEDYGGSRRRMDRDGTEGYG